MLRLLIAAVVVLAMFASAPAAERNVIFFITDDESPTLGCYGDNVAVTPAIDALAKDGTLFRNAFATTASCSASRSVIMTGLHNHSNGQYGHEHAYHHFTSFADVVGMSLPRVMAGAGYRTAHIGKYHVGPEEVYHFETYLKGNERSTVQLVEACQDFITKKDDKPFFLYIGTADPHRGGGDDQTSSLEFKPNLFGNKANRKAFPQINEVFFDPAKVPVPAFLPDTPDCRAELAQYYQSCARIDQGFGRLVAMLKEAGLYDKTLIVFTADHGIAMPGAKTTVYDPGLRVPFVLRNPYQPKRGVVSEAMISHVDITPSLLDFAGGLDAQKKRPKNWKNPELFWKEKGARQRENRGTPASFAAYHGRSWLLILGETNPSGWDTIFASHTFHEIQMYYPMRVIQDRKYKLIWNMADGLPFPFASDLWDASTWQTQLKKGMAAPYGRKSVKAYIHRPKFELYDMQADPHETENLALDPNHAALLTKYQQRLKTFQKEHGDPWIMKWDYE